MESRFSKYESVNNGKSISNHIANVNTFVGWLGSKGCDLIEKEIQLLSEKINAGTAPAIFSQKVSSLIELGKAIEKVHEVYTFNRKTEETNFDLFAQAE